MPVSDPSLKTLYYRLFLSLNENLMNTFSSPEKTRLPYLDTLEREERTKLEGELIDESKKMHNDFATLAYNTIISLSTNVQVEHLKFLIENSSFYRSKVYEDR